MVNFYRRHLKDAAQTQAILHEMLEGAKKKDKSKVPWTKESIKQFEKCYTDLLDRKWAIIGRDNWKPGPSAEICLDHFEESQFESLCKDRKKLRKTAVPTLFSIPNPPPSVTDKRIREVRCPKPNTEVETLPASNEELLKKIEFLEQQLQEKDAKLTSFLSDEQVGTLAVQSKRNWSEKSIIKGLKMRFALEQTWI
ncbi:uncharacterized protein LOC118193561 [Stegodyphus dumicola]|uniref:uncharacterized protein LOC118193561 n=1 Tax=Stegodyphus dumicola TaxID=202533 RepID=UPI0015AD0824|nr:uncharacterized protein LOC118193561 [Stegodyphus dumicola]